MSRIAGALCALAAALAAAAPAAAAAEVPPEVRRQLADPDPKVRGDGLKALKERMDEEAVRAVVPLLDDRDPYCRDYACWNLLARVTDPAAAKVLAEKGPRVSTAAGRLAAADALAAVRDPQALQALLFLCGDREPRVRETAIDGLGRRGSPEVPKLAEAVAAALADPAPGVRAAALEAAARLKLPGAAESLEKALADGDPGVRTAAAGLLAAASPERLAGVFGALVTDPDWGVRLTAARSAGALGAAPPAEALAALLEDPRIRVADAAHDALRHLSGLDLPPVKADWLAWWNGEKAKWRGPPRHRMRDADRPSTAVYHGLPFRSNAVLFAIDLSGSMDQPLGAVDGRPRIVVAAEELGRTLHALPDGASADVLAFMLEPARAAGRLLELKGGARERLQKWFERQARGRRGDLGGALAAAILDGEADTVILLADGAASAGDCLFRERIQERARQVLRRRPVLLHAVAFGSRPQDRKFLEDLAALTGGHCVDR